MIVVLVLVALITKASDTHNPISILLYALVFSSSMHDRYFVFQVYAMLRIPSSV